MRAVMREKRFCIYPHASFTDKERAGNHPLGMGKVEIKGGTGSACLGIWAAVFIPQETQPVQRIGKHLREQLCQGKKGRETLCFDP